MTQLRDVLFDWGDTLFSPPDAGKVIVAAAAERGVRIDPDKAHSFEVGAEKPDPAIFLRACEALGTKPAETLMVGDHPVADAGALKAGLLFHLLPPDGAVEKPRGLDHVVAIVDASMSDATKKS